MNLFAQLDCDGQEEKTDVLFENLHVRIERIVSSGQVSPEGFWYEQDEDEWVTVLQGEGRIQYEKGDVRETAFYCRQENGTGFRTPANNLLASGSVCLAGRKTADENTG